MDFKDPVDPVNNVAFRIRRQPLGDHVADWVRFIESSKESPPTPDEVAPTNPVPEFMESLGLANVNIPHTIEPDLMHGQDLELWDGKKVLFYLFRHKHLRSPFNGGFFPGPTIRIPRGAVFHAKTHGHGPPPHTIHWHGLEPSPMNDGVGHCSFEIGSYTYQFQPNFIGTFFYHCHRSTVQHFKFGLNALLFVEPPDAFEKGPDKNPGGYPRRTAAALVNFPQFPGFIGGDLSNENPRAQTVPYDVEAAWSIDDLDSVWTEKMPDPRADNARPGNNPGKDDRFVKADFHDFNPDYFFVTGVGFPGRPGETATLPPTKPIPAALNSGVTGMQIAVTARTNQTILIRVVISAYSNVRIKFPVDGLIIAFDGRSLGVPPTDRYCRPIPLPAGQTIKLTTARRFDILIRTDRPIHGFAEVEYLNHRDRSLIFTGLIPIDIYEGGSKG